MRAQIYRLRQRSQIQERESLDQIGCIILSEPVFVPRDLWIPQPTDWAKANLRYARYDLAAGEGLRVWRECLERAAGLALPAAPAAVVDEHRERFGARSIARNRATGISMIVAEVTMAVSTCFEPGHRARAFP